MGVVSLAYYLHCAIQRDGIIHLSGHFLVLLLDGVV